MGTAKRERQKANRAKRIEQETQAERSTRRRRQMLQWGIGITAAFAGLLLIAFIGGVFSTEDDVVSTVTSAPSATSEPSATSGAPVTSAPATSEAPTATTTAATTATENASEPQTTAPNNPADSSPATTQAAVQTTVPDDALDAAAAVGNPSSSTECPPVDGSAEQTRQFESAPPLCIDLNATYTAEIVTNMGTMSVELYPDRAPNTVNSFITLARYNYFNDTVCHRIITDFVIQCGDPTATGTGGPGYATDDELPPAGEYKVGSLAMANSGPDTQGSQFFIITGDQGVNLPPLYSLFGQVTEGLEVADQIQRVATDNGDKPLEDVVIESVTITES